MNHLKFKPMKNAIRLRWTENTCMGGYSSFRSFSNAETDFNVTKFHKSWKCEKISPKESDLHAAAVCRVSNPFGESDNGQRNWRWTKEVGQRETNSVFLLLFQCCRFYSPEKKYLGRYINTIFFYYKRYTLRMWCLCFFFFRCKNLPDNHEKFVSMPVFRNSCMSCYIWDRTRTCWYKPS